MKRIKLTVAYDGTNYCGWQIQPNGLTIEEVLNKTIQKITGEDLKVTGASRTDSGVHALGNVAVFDTNSSIPAERMKYALNQKLPEDIAIVCSEEVEPEFHPRFCPTNKTYEYHIINQEIPIPTKRLTNYFISYTLDIEAMKKAAEYLVGTHDFASFCSSKTGVEDTVRSVYELELLEQGEQLIIRIRGNGFLYNMVRIIVGTLLQVGRGFYQPLEVKEMLEARERTKAGATAPPHGLHLIHIEYL